MKQKLRDYIYNQLLECYRKLDDEENSSIQDAILVNKIKILEDIEKICTNRGRF